MLLHPVFFWAGHDPIPASTSGQGLPPPCHVHFETCGILKGAVHEVGAEAVPQTQSVRLEDSRREKGGDWCFLTF